MANINGIEMPNNEMAEMFIIGAIWAIEVNSNMVPIKRCIEKYGSKFVWQVAGNKLRAIGLKEEDLPGNDREFLGEEHDMEN